jgi:hypothetical protein
VNPAAGDPIADYSHSPGRLFGRLNMRRSTVRALSLRRARCRADGLRALPRVSVEGDVEHVQGSLPAVRPAGPAQIRAAVGLAELIEPVARALAE